MTHIFNITRHILVYSGVLGNIKTNKKKFAQRATRDGSEINNERNIPTTGALFMAIRRRKKISLA